MSSQLRHFCFTFNNFNKVNGWEEKLKSSLLGLGANYYIWGQEIAPSTGTPHLQGYVQLEKRKAFSLVTKSLSGLHITPCLGSSQDNVNYCNKECTSVVECGTLRTIARRRAKQAMDWQILIEMASAGQLDEIREHHPREYALYYRTWGQMRMDNLKTVAERRTCLWVYGKPGIGKSRAAWSLFPDAYPKMSNKWWDGYKGQRDVVFDDLGTPMLFDLLKRWSDRYKVIGEVKGSSCALAYKNLIVTSNYSIRQLAMKSNPEVDEVTIQAVQRRFVELEGLEWDEEFEDLRVKDSRGTIETLRALHYDLLQDLDLD